MDNRKWEADAIVSPPTAPASPSDGYPTNGDPGAAQNATEPGAWWFHALGEELRAVIIEGGLTPNISTLTQLRDAIKNIAKGGDYKASVRVASTAAINLAAPGANIDGVAMVAGNRFLEKDNATLENRGIYIWNGAAVPATRALDADTGAEFNGGAIIPVEEGTTNADTNWQVTNNGTVTIGTTALTFAVFGTTADASPIVKGILKLATDALTQAGVDTSTAVTPASLSSRTATEARTGLVEKASAVEAQTFTAEKYIDAERLRDAFNATGSAPFFPCRAWGNFNGIGTVAIRGSGNISSITDGGTGYYTANFTTALPDANYSVSATCGDDAAANLSPIVNAFTYSNTSCPLRTVNGTGASIDYEWVSFNVFR